MSQTILKKLRRLQSQPARTVDLFSGCGGLSLGFRAAGCEIVAAVEGEPTRAKTHARNFHPRASDVHGRPRDIIKTQAFDLLRELGLEGTLDAIDLIVGGPPCQAYARVGRAKLAEVADKHEAYLDDGRGRLWEEYLRFVEDLQPVALLMENVPDILRYGRRNVADDIARQLDALGYECRYTLLNAANFGVPQMRERWYLIGIHKSVDAEPRFPAPTHYFDVPPGYRGTRAAARALQQTKLFKSGFLVDLYDAEPALKNAVTCEEALGDLPSISEAVKHTGKGARDLGARLSHGTPPQTDYQRLMRNWPGFASDVDVTAHVIRYLPRDFETFGRMKEGGEYPAAIAAAESIVHERARALGILPDSAAWTALYASIVPPYKRDKFPNKWVKLRHDFPSRTLMAHLSHDSYSHIHYSAEQARTISVREAARLQSFPDGFQFCGAMNAAFGQIGNAVPPLMAQALARQILARLREPVARRTLAPQRHQPAMWT